MPSGVLRPVQAGGGAGKEWAEYLFRDGSMIGLNKDILCQYIEYITNIRMQAVGRICRSRRVLTRFHGSTPAGFRQRAGGAAGSRGQLLPVGQIDSEVGENDFDDFQL